VKPKSHQGATPGFRQEFVPFPPGGATRAGVRWVIETIESVSRREPAVNLQSSRYDPELQMLIDPPRDPDPACLRFLRWLAEISRLEHEPVGLPAGRYAGEVLRCPSERGDGRGRTEARLLNASR